ncbi:hypothetical protein M0P98_01535 [bacterium]|nr:hypothetical protein [bacterium]
MDKNRLKEYARKVGADIVGIANIERFKELPAEKHPSSIFPETKSIIIIGRRITRGTLRGVEEGTNFTNYLFFGADWLENRFTAVTTFSVSEFLEDNGWEAVPLPNIPPEVPTMGVSVKQGGLKPNVLLDFEDAAVRAGVGEIGYCGVLVTPEFGPRQRIQMILTDAEIEPDPIVVEDICPRESEFKNFCPLGAFIGEKEITIAGKKMLVAEIDYNICSSCKNGAMANPSHPAGKPDRLAAVCIRSYSDYLERNNRIKNKFELDFRQRKPWVVLPDTNLFKI